jgi:hypothetical protein
MTRKPRKYQVIYNVIVGVWAMDEDEAQEAARLAITNDLEIADLECMDIIKEEE